MDHSPASSMYDITTILLFYNMIISLARQACEYCSLDVNNNHPCRKYMAWHGDMAIANRLSFLDGAQKCAMPTTPQMQQRRTWNVGIPAIPPSTLFSYNAYNS